MLKRLFSALLIIALIFSLVACNADDGKISETEEPIETSAESGTQKPADDSSKSEQTSSHTHEFGEWALILEPGCGTDGIEQRACSCGEKEQRSIAAASAHDVVGNEKIGFCRKCLSIVKADSLALPTAADNVKTTVTKEEWMQAFELETLESFTLDAEQVQFGAYGHCPSDLEEYPEEINWDIVLWRAYANLLNATIKYNDGCIYADQALYILEADEEDDLLEAVEQSASAGGEIEMNTFREIDWFTELQIYEILDDTIYDYEDYGFSKAVYSEESRTYRIDLDLSEGIDAYIEIMFEDGYVRAMQFYLLQNDEDGEYQYQSFIMIFSDINADKKVSEIDARDIYNAYGEIVSEIGNATACKIYNARMDDDEPMDFELDTLKDIVDGFVLKKVGRYVIGEDGTMYIDLEGEMRYLDGVEFDYNGDGDDHMSVYIGRDGSVEKIEFRSYSYGGERHYALVNSEYYLIY